MTELHCPVLLQEAVAALAVQSEGTYMDATFGRGGHTAAILQQMQANGRVFALDQDPAAVAFGQQTFKDESRLEITQTSFAALTVFAKAKGLMGKVNGLLLDLGVSSPQLDQAARGFSFMHDGPLDMRMDTQQAVTAADWLADAEVKNIAHVLRTYGEERYAWRIAKALVQAREQQAITRTGQLAQLIKDAHPRWEQGKHPATRSFQAIRIFINDELGALQQCLAQSIDVLALGGRLVVISFHSLEDRIVKRFMREQARGDYFPSKLPVTQTQLAPQLRCVGKAIRAEQDEVINNPRARSAVLRIAEKLT